MQRKSDVTKDAPMDDTADSQSNQTDPVQGGGVIAAGGNTDGTTGAALAAEASVAGAPEGSIDTTNATNGRLSPRPRQLFDRFLGDRTGEEKQEQMQVFLQIRKCGEPMLNPLHSCRECKVSLQKLCGTVVGKGDGHTRLCTK